MDQAPQHFSKPNAGLPPLDPGASAMSPFEFMSPKLFYIPVVGYALYLMLKHRSITVPTLANPAIFAGGAIGERKSDVLNLAGNYAKTHIAPFVVVDKGAAQATFENAMAALSASEIAFPIVAKPDTGLRGAGVRPINTAAELRAYIEDFPAQRTIMLQKKVEHSAEAGVFYIRRPKQPTGEIFSLTLKYTATITGDGTRTIGDLIDACPRSFKLRDLYRTRHHAVLDHVLPKGEERAINFAGNHAKGAIFRDGAKHITPAMTHAFDTVAKDFPDLHFARFDVRFETLEKLKQGGAFDIVEVNGVGAEATHIWDCDMRFLEAYRVLMRQWRLAFEIGAANRQRPHQATPWRKLLKMWAKEMMRAQDYPMTH